MVACVVTYLNRCVIIYFGALPGWLVPPVVSWLSA